MYCAKRSEPCPITDIQFVKRPGRTTKREIAEWFSKEWPTYQYYELPNQDTYLVVSSEFPASPIARTKAALAAPCIDPS